MCDVVGSYLDNNMILQKISDIMRIVDPLLKKVVVNSEGNVSIHENTRCFDLWGKNQACDNCISMRAYNDNKTFMKFEYAEDKTYLVSAVPQDLPDRRVVVEILKDITDTMSFNMAATTGFKSHGIQTLIDHLNKLAFSDPLTKLYNRRYIAEKLPVDLLNATLLFQDISIIMADIDHFKTVNDQYGHLVGDQALKHVADILSVCKKEEATGLRGMAVKNSWLVCLVLPLIWKSRWLKICANLSRSPLFIMMVRS